MAAFRRIVAPALAILALAGSACSTRSPMEPVAARPAPAGAALSGAASERSPLGVLADRFTRGNGFVDLGFNRLTRVAGVFRARTILTGQQPGPWLELPFSTERLVVGVQTPVGGGPTYRHERVRHLEDTGPTTTFDLWRQDRSGLYLYQPDLSARTARPGPLALARAASAPEFARAWDDVAAKRAALLAGPPGGPTALEITFLRYPLHKGASWEGRPGFNLWTVEDLEWLATPAGRFRAARLRIELPEFFGPLDRALTWWDAPGEVKRQFHLFGTAVDAGGNVIGEIETLETFELVAYEQDVPL